jgi:hypothetical protein
MPRELLPDIKEGSMGKEPIKYKSKPRRKAEYTKEGTTDLEKLQEANEGRFAQEIDNVITGGPKRGHGRGKASDAGPSRKRVA